MIERLALTLYAAATRALQPLMLRRLRRRGRTEPGYLHAMGERLGRYDGPAPGHGWVWVHAVSLGETRAAAVLVAALRDALPGMRLLLTHGTATGRAEGRALLREGDAQAWLPWDTPAAVDGFLAHFRPALGVLMETEVWPVLVARCRAAGVPLALANARLNEASWRAARRLGPLARAAYGGLSAAWAQAETDARRLSSLGAPVMGVFGNLKFDAAPDENLLARGRAWRAQAGAPVVLLASSREGEEAEFLQTVEQKWPVPRVEWTSGATENVADAGGAERPAVRWLIVPRHPQRFAEVADLAERRGWRVSRRSQWSDAGHRADAAGPQARPDAPSAVLWIGDSLGEMAAYYAMADVALLGGSFAPLGGQNLIEAAACGCPVVMGPHTFNFAEAAQLSVEAGAGLRAQTMSQALVLAAELVARADRRDAMAAAARTFAQAHRGAAQRTAQAIAALLRR